MALRDDIQAEGVKYAIHIVVACLVAVGASVAMTHDHGKRLNIVEAEQDSAGKKLDRMEGNQRLIICLLESDDCDPRNLLKKDE